MKDFVLSRLSSCWEVQMCNAIVMLLPSEKLYFGIVCQQSARGSHTFSVHTQLGFNLINLFPKLVFMSFNLFWQFSWLPYLLLVLLFIICWLKCLLPGQQQNCQESAYEGDSDHEFHSLKTVSRSTSPAETQAATKSLLRETQWII